MVTIIILDDQSLTYKELNLPLTTKVAEIITILKRDKFMNDEYQFLIYRGKEITNDSLTVGHFTKFENKTDGSIIVVLKMISKYDDSSSIQHYTQKISSMLKTMERSIVSIKSASDTFLSNSYAPVNPSVPLKSCEDIPGLQERCSFLDEKDHRGYSYSQIEHKDEMTVADFSLQPGNFDDETFGEIETVCTSLSQPFESFHPQFHPFYQTKTQFKDLNQELLDTSRFHSGIWDESHVEQKRTW